MGDMVSSSDKIAGLFQDPSDKVIQQLPEGYTKDDAKRLALYLRGNADLARCTPESIYQCILKAAHLGLSIDLGDVYVYPRGTTAQFHIGYQGLIKLLKASGEVVNVKAEVVREGEHVRIQRSTDADQHYLVHEIDPFNDGPIVGAYALFTFRDGSKEFELMRKSEIEAVKAKASRSMMWSDFYSEGAKKAVIRRGVKTLSLLPDHQRAIVEADAEEYDLSEKRSRPVKRANQLFAPKPAPQIEAADDDLEIDQVEHEPANETIDV